MLDRILLATDLSEDGATAWDVAIALVQRAGRSELPVLYMAEAHTAYAEVDAPRAAQRLYDDDRLSADEGMKRYAELCEAQGIHVRPIVRLGEPAESIVKTAREENVDLIVLGIRRADAIDRLLGKSIVGQVTRMAPCHVLCVKPHRAT
ncbi:MAG TPA: universal stress protein [Methylomirabilota bacterium]|jgi:nucleotide-binding universal stress UspA family protein|nr:universal stress protein [Methylomirabilota bacterium]